MALIINLFGAPGAGKSTGAAYIFSQLKMAGIDVELVTEFVKDKVWEESKEVFNNQAYIFGKQFFKISRCSEKVDVIITDSPLLLSILYNNCDKLTENFNKTVLDVFNSYESLNYLIVRNKPYNPNGRLQTEEESDIIYSELKDLLSKYSINYTECFGDIKGYNQIIDQVKNYLKEN